MNLKPSKTSTVIIVDKGKGSTKTLQVKTKHISRIRHYAASILALILILSGVIIYLENRNMAQQEETSKALAQITKLKKSIPIDTPQVKKTTDAQSYIQ